MKINLKNKTFWLSIASAIVLMAQQIGQLFGFSVASDTIMQVVNAICGVLIVLGILNNPAKETDNEKILEESESPANDEKNLDEK